MDAESHATVICALFTCFATLATNHPAIFADFYENVFDIVCGWRTDVDHAVDVELHANIASLLVALTPWIQSLTEHTKKYALLFDEDLRTKVAEIERRLPTGKPDDLKQLPFDVKRAALILAVHTQIVTVSLLNVQGAKASALLNDTDYVQKVQFCAIICRISFRTFCLSPK